MSAEELKLILSQPLALFAIMLLASLGSAIKQLIVARREKPELSLVQYFTKNLPETIIMLMHNGFAFGTLIMTDSLNWAAALGIGYLANDAADVWTAEGRSTAIGSKQGGFARPLMLAMIASLSIIVMLVAGGCASNSPQTQLILETTTRIAVRRALESDRAIEKARNIREVAQTLHGLVTAESTIAGLRDTVLVELDKLNLAPVDKADATDLVNLFAAILEERYGDDLAGDERMVKVRGFLDIVLRALPATT